MREGKREIETERERGRERESWVVAVGVRHGLCVDDLPIKKRGSERGRGRGRERDTQRETEKRERKGEKKMEAWSLSSFMLQSCSVSLVKRVLYQSHVIF